MVRPVGAGFAEAYKWALMEGRTFSFAYDNANGLSREQLLWLVGALTFIVDSHWHPERRVAVEGDL